MPRLLAFFVLIGLVACSPSAPLSSTPAPLVSPSTSPSLQPAPGAQMPSSTPISSTPMAPPSASDLPSDLDTGTRDIQALRLESTRFLSASGQRVALDVRDQDGIVVAPERLRFVSSRPQDLSVDAQGNVMAQVDNGFSTITIALLGSDLQIVQVFSISTPSTSGGGSGGSGSAPNQENVSGQVAFQF